jgi:hypothetical protein
MNVREWLARHLDKVSTLRIDPKVAANLVAMLNVVCWRIEGQSDWHDEAPYVSGYTERGQNSMQVADETVKAITKAKMTVPPDVEFNVATQNMVLAFIEQDDRSVEFQVGPYEPIVYTKNNGKESCTGALGPSNTAIRELFRFVATGKGQWVA